jgi:predicted metal-dependent phosphoesterase TrpH
MSPRTNDILSPVVEAEPVSTSGAGPGRRAPGTRIDLHCHTTFSDERLGLLPGLVFHPLLEPEQVYDLAKSRGMDFVTITDHDTIDGCKALLDRRGNLRDFIIGEEVSVTFPEDGTIVHVNVFDHDETQHRELQRLRGNIYEICTYLREIDKLHVLNHMTWTSQHRVLKTWQIEAMLELFPVFEGLNGTRSYAHNAFAWYATRDRGKVLVAGSDSHANRVGTTYTLTEGTTRAEVLANIRAGQTAICGAFGTPEKLREDVWLVLSKNVERRLLEAHSRWERFICRAVRGIGRAFYPLVCFGYHSKQNLLIRDFVRALPA